MATKKGYSFRDGVRLQVPRLFARFLKHGKTAFGGPDEPGTLHRLRLDGKPLRYLMELADPFFGPGFRAGTKEIKRVVTLLGGIHDLDVAIAALESFDRELRRFNSARRSPSARISPAGVHKTLASFRARRAELLSALKVRLAKWRETGFRRRLIAPLE